MTIAKGSFDVTMNPQPPYFEGDGVVLAHATFDKTFAGSLEATSQVHFISVRAGDAAAYVALERIEGTLDGQKGSFVVTHKAQASKSGQDLVIEIVPGTGTGGLAGITGAMSIEIVEGKHLYAIDYALG